MTILKRIFETLRRLMRWIPIGRYIFKLWYTAHHHRVYDLSKISVGNNTYASVSVDSIPNTRTRTTWNISARVFTITIRNRRSLLINTGFAFVENIILKLLFYMKIQQTAAIGSCRPLLRVALTWKNFGSPLWCFVICKWGSIPSS